MKYSVIVPVYNRPDEVDELLESLTAQTFKDFEVIIVEDGSTLSCKETCKGYDGALDIHYFFKDNSGPGKSRNYGAERAKGEYLIILDSDVVLPPQYFDAVNKELDNEYADAFGGPDCAHPSFTDTQKAISYSMTSFFTTGGIRGGKKKKLDKFYPRSFNMGIKRLLRNALRRRHRLLHTHIQGRMQVPPVPRRMGMAQAPHRLPQVFPAGLQQRHSPHKPL